MNTNQTCACTGVPLKVHVKIVMDICVCTEKMPEEAEAPQHISIVLAY